MLIHLCRRIRHLPPGPELEELPIRCISPISILPSLQIQHNRDRDQELQNCNKKSKSGESDGVAETVISSARAHTRHEQQVYVTCQDNTRQDTTRSSGGVARPHSTADEGLAAVSLQEERAQPSPLCQAASVFLSTTRSLGQLHRQPATRPRSVGSNLKRQVLIRSAQLVKRRTGKLRAKRRSFQKLCRADGRHLPRAGGREHLDACGTRLLRVVTETCRRGSSLTQPHPASVGLPGAG